MSNNDSATKKEQGRFVVTSDEEFDIEYPTAEINNANPEGCKQHTCNVFPKGIPLEITSGENMHTEPYPGDHEIQYEKETPTANTEDIDTLFAALGIKT